MEQHSQDPDPSGSWVILEAGPARLGIAASEVDAITDVPEATPIPRSPSYLLGLANVRGEAVPLVSLSSFLELADEGEDLGTSPGDGQRVLVVRSGELHVGLQCERVLGLRQVDTEQVREAGLVRGGRIQEFSRSEVDLSDGLVALLDTTALLEEARVRA